MVSAIDIAGYVLSKIRFAPTMKLQKLVYYIQAYALAAYGEPLFCEDFEAWANGPVCPELFEAHKGLFIVGSGDLDANGRSSSLTAAEVVCVDHILACLGDLTGRQLSEIALAEEPWLNARGGLPATARCNNMITKQAIASYYSSPACINPAFAAAASAPCPAPPQRLTAAA